LVDSLAQHRLAHGFYTSQFDVQRLSFFVYVCVKSGVNSAAVIRKIKADGWVLVHTVGSHHQFKHPSKPGKVTVPHPKKDLPLPTVRSIFKQAGL